MKSRGFIWTSGSTSQFPRLPHSQSLLTGPAGVLNSPGHSLTCTATKKAGGKIIKNKLLIPAGCAYWTLVYICLLPLFLNSSPPKKTKPKQNKTKQNKTKQNKTKQTDTARSQWTHLKNKSIFTEQRTVPVSLLLWDNSIKKSSEVQSLTWQGKCGQHREAYIARWFILTYPPCHSNGARK